MTWSNVSMDVLRMKKRKVEERRESGGRKRAKDRY
jgi:hypothetical protein